MENQPVHLLVTGGAGFIGSNFIRHWLTGHPADTVTNLDLLTYAGDREKLSDVERAYGDCYRFVRGDVADAALVRALMRGDRADLIVHFAAESHNSRAVVDPSTFVRTNVLGTHVLLEAAREQGTRFHHISTCEVYGDLPLESDQRFAERSPYRPTTPYNASKAAADLLVRSYHLTFGLPVTTSISSNNYGPWQHPEKVIPLFATNALEGRALPLYRSSQHRREWMHVEDHCRAIELVIEHGRIGEAYNVGTGDERTIEEIADSVLAALGQPPALKTYVQDRPGHDRRYLLDHSKIREELGWAPRIAFADGLATTIDWYRANPAWWRMKKEQQAGGLDEFAWPAAARSPG